MAVLATPPRDRNLEDSDAGDGERLAQANRHHALGFQYFREKRYQRALDELSRA